jgi:hypothetical protein
MRFKQIAFLVLVNGFLAVAVDVGRVGGVGCARRPPLAASSVRLVVCHIVSYKPVWRPSGRE